MLKHLTWFVLHVPFLRLFLLDAAFFVPPSVKRRGIDRPSRATCAEHLMSNSCPGLCPVVRCSPTHVGYSSSTNQNGGTMSHWNHDMLWTHGRISWVFLVKNVSFYSGQHVKCAQKNEYSSFYRSPVFTLRFVLRFCVQNLPQPIPRVFFVV